jgi:TolA-binding protein
MNHPVDVHPEELLDREHWGVLTFHERQRLEAHAARCAACALVRRAALDFAVERSAWPADDALIEAMTSGAFGAPPASGRFENLPRRASPRRRRRSWAMAAIVMFAATGAAASLWSVRRVLLPHAVVNVAPMTHQEGGDVRGSPPASKVDLLAVPTQVPAAPTDPSRLAPPRELGAAGAPAARPRPSEESPLSAEQVFASANEARRRGDSSQAVKLYRQLQQQFPGTREETTSRVLLGRLLLDRGDDASQALALFTRYLEQSPNGTLAEEARLGRALALMRLGRPLEERQAWQQLLSAHPNTIHAERARKRLDELR